MWDPLHRTTYPPNAPQYIQAFKISSFNCLFAGIVIEFKIDGRISLISSFGVIGNITDNSWIIGCRCIISNSILSLSFSSFFSFSSSSSKSVYSWTSTFTMSMGDISFMSTMIDFCDHKAQHKWIHLPSVVALNPPWYIGQRQHLIASFILSISNISISVLLSLFLSLLLLLLLSMSSSLSLSSIFFSLSLSLPFKFLSSFLSAKICIALHRSQKKSPSGISITP